MSCSPESRKRIAIIGAGCSGLTAIKSCLEEDLDPICFESSEDIGGLWRYTELKEGTDIESSSSSSGLEQVSTATASSVYASCHINTCKEMTAFSDFPVARDVPNAMSHQEMFAYLHDYAEHFKLRPHIRFHCKVLNVRRDYGNPGHWIVTYHKEIKHLQSASDDDVGDEMGKKSHEVNGKRLDIVEESFHGVMACSGHHRYPHVPSIEGLNTFAGTVIHSCQYRKPDVFTGKRILIVGFGNSAVDIAVDVAHHAHSVHLSSRRGGWLISRLGPFGYPADALANSRFAAMFPRSWMQWVVEKGANWRCDHQLYGLTPKHRALESHPTINDDLHLELLKGRVRMKPGISRVIAPYEVEFRDGSVLTFDAMILATGFEYLFPYLPADVLCVDQENRMLTPLYKATFPIATAQLPTLGIISLLQPVGAILPVAELQTRWFARVVTGKSQLPDQTTMLKHTKEREKWIRDSYVPSRRHTLESFWIEAMDSIAEEVGCKPSIWRLLCQDPELALHCMFGPCIAAQYRLHGPGAKYALARHLILGTMERITYPLRGGPWSTVAPTTRPEHRATTSEKQGAYWPKRDHFVTTVRKWWLLLIVMVAFAWIVMLLGFN